MARPGRKGHGPRALGLAPPSLQPTRYDLAMDKPQPTPPFTGQLVPTPWSYKMWMLLGSRERFFDRLIADFGDFVHYRGLIEFTLVNHPALVRQVLQGTNDTFDKRSQLYDRFRRAFGTGLVVAEGEGWKRRRKVVQQLMGPRQVQSYFELMLDAADQVARD